MIRVASLLAAATVAGLADNVVLTGEGRLSGTVRGIDESGVVELASELTDQPLKMNASAVDKVEFQADPHPTSANAILELANGDRLPVTLGNMDGSKLLVTSADAGALSVRRDAIKSLQVGVHERRVIYTGPRSQAEWSSEWDGSKGWRFADNGVVATGNAKAEHKFDLPRQFTLKFLLKWEGNPNFEIKFADPLTTNAERTDRYILQFNAAGFEIRRESSKGKAIQTVISPVHGADQFFSREVAVEVRVDRSTSRIHLYLNGEPETSGIDLAPEPPTGGGISFASLSTSQSEQQIRDIEISQLDSAGDRHRTEDRGDTSMDSLISREDDRWGGRLQSIRPTTEGAVFVFKSDFQDQPLEISDKDVATVFFAKPAKEEPESPANPFVLKLRGDGSLHVTSCKLSEAGVTAVHPLLGELKIARNGLTALEKAKAIKKEEVKPAKEDEDK